MATPNELYGWFPGMDQRIPGGTDRWMTTPEQSQSSLLGFTGQRGPMSELAYQLAGSPRMRPPESTTISTPPYIDESSIDGAGGGSPVGDLNSLNSLYEKGSGLYDSLLGGSQVPAGANPADLGSLGSAGLAGISGSALFGAGGASAALGAAAPVAADTALANLGSLTASEMFGSSASLAAGSGPGSLGATGGTSSLGSSGAAASSGSGGALASSGISTALPIAAIAWMAADALNKSGDEKSGATTALRDQLLQQPGWSWAKGTGRIPTLQMPDGGQLRIDGGARAVSEALRAGDQEAAQKAWEAWLATARYPGKGG